MDLEVCEPVDAPLDDYGRIQVHELPAGQMASLVMHGSCDGFTAAYRTLMAWIQANGYHIAGPSREHYLRSMADPSATPDDLVTETQFPVLKA